MNMVEKTPIGIYHTLLKHYGPQHWWPAETPFEVVVGAVLTQRTSWKNVEIAIENLKRVGLMSVDTMAKSGLGRIRANIKASGFYKVKARRILNLARHLKTNYGSLKRFFSKDVSSLRKELLAFEGIGKETADSIILYAGEKPIFVVDTYTKRLCSRLPLPVKNYSYDEVQTYFQCSLPRSVKLYKEFHALIVAQGKRKCRTRPTCSQCPLLRMCNFPKKRKKNKKKG